MCDVVSNPQVAHNTLDTQHWTEPWATEAMGPAHNKYQE